MGTGVCTTTCCGAAGVTHAGTSRLWCCPNPRQVGGPEMPGAHTPDTSLVWLCVCSQHALVCLWTGRHAQVSPASAYRAPGGSPGGHGHLAAGTTEAVSHSVGRNTLESFLRGGPGDTAGHLAATGGRGHMDWHAASHLLTVTGLQSPPTLPLFLAYSSSTHSQKCPLRPNGHRQQSRLWVS